MDRAGAYFRWCRLHLLGRAIQENLKKKKKNPFRFGMRRNVSQKMPRWRLFLSCFWASLLGCLGQIDVTWHVFIPLQRSFSFFSISRLPPPKRSSRSCEECQPDSFSFRVYKTSPLRFKYLCYIPQRSLPVSLIHTGSLSFKCRLVSL